MASGSPLRRQRREVGFSWLDRLDTDACFTLPRRGHAFPRNNKVADRFAYNLTSIGNLTYSEVTHTRLTISNPKTSTELETNRRAHSDIISLSRRA